MNRRYLIRRLAQVVPTVLGILVLTFLLVHVAPHEPARDFAGEGADQAQIDEAASYLGLDRPLPEQFVDYVGRVVSGDFGVSFGRREPVIDLIGDRLPATLLLTGSAVLVSTVGGILLGAFAARRPHGIFDVGVNTLTLMAYSLPAFWLAQMAIFAIALKLGWLPAGGMNDAREAFTGLDAARDTLRHLVLPALVLAVSEVALLARVTRTGILAEAGKSYLQAARAKGVTEQQAIAHHALPNAVLPVITVVGSRIGFLVSGAVLVETVFAWPGLGRLLVDAGQTGDHPLILGMVLLVSFTVVAVNLMTDLVYAWVDPRIRYH